MDDLVCGQNCRISPVISRLVGVRQQYHENGSYALFVQMCKSQKKPADWEANRFHLFFLNCDIINEVTLFHFSYHLLSDQMNVVHSRFSGKRNVATGICTFCTENSTLFSIV
jgi:hypothetical protein